MPSSRSRSPSPTFDRPILSPDLFDSGNEEDIWEKKHEEGWLTTRKKKRNVTHDQVS